MPQLKNRKALIPSDGAKGFLKNPQSILLTVVLLIYFILLLRQTAVFSSAGCRHEGATLLIIAAACMFVGMLSAVLVAYLAHDNVFPSFGIIAVFIGTLLLSAYSVVSFINLPLGFWGLASACETLSSASLVPLFLCILCSFYNIKAVPLFGNIASVCCTCSLILLLIRILVSFSGVYSVGGQSLIFSSAEASDTYSQEILWIFATLTPDVEHASSLMIWRLTERLSMAILLLVCVVFSSAYADYFRQFNKKLDAANDLPDSVLPIIPERRSSRPSTKQINIQEAPPHAVQKAEPSPEPQRFRSRSDPERRSESRTAPVAEPSTRSANTRSAASRSFNPRETRAREQRVQNVRETGAASTEAAVDKAPATVYTSSRSSEPERKAVKVRINRPTPTPAQPAAKTEQKPIPELNDESIWNRYSD